jgi:rhamnogalacturonyl hydrolase YesR
MQPACLPSGVRNGAVERVKWSYNAGLALAALTALYQSTKDEQYLLRVISTMTRTPD